MTWASENMLPTAAIGREIGIIQPHEFRENEGFIVYFTDGSTLEIKDEQDCTEIRWMHSDDDLGYYAGSKLMGMELREGPETEDDGEHHRCMFLLVTTSLGVFTIVAHNRHNGYYAGMDPHCKFKEKK